MINTSVFAVPVTQTNHSNLQRPELLIIKSLEEKLHSKMVHDRKKIDASLTRADFIYQVYHLLETGLSSM